MKDKKFSITKVYLSKLSFEVKEEGKFETSQKSNEKIALGIGKNDDHDIKFTREFHVSGPNFKFSAEANCVVHVDSSYNEAIKEIKSGNKFSKDSDKLIGELANDAVDVMFNKVNIYLGQLSMEVNSYPLMPELGKVE